MGLAGIVGDLGSFGGSLGSALILGPEMLLPVIDESSCASCRLWLLACIDSIMQSSDIAVAVFVVFFVFARQSHVF